MTFHVYMCVKLTTGDLYYDSYPTQPTSTYTYRVTIAPRVRGSAIKSFDVLKIITTTVNVIQY